MLFAKSLFKLVTTFEITKHQRIDSNKTYTVITELLQVRKLVQNIAGA